jgi:hypothetical protein
MMNDQFAKSDPDTEIRLMHKKWFCELAQMSLNLELGWHPRLVFVLAKRAMTQELRVSLGCIDEMNWHWILFEPLTPADFPSDPHELDALISSLGRVGQ